MSGRSPAGTPAGGAGRRGRAQWGAAVGGFALGFVVDWLVIAVTVVAAYATWGETAPSAAQWVLLPVAFVVVPVVAGVGALRRLRVPFVVGLALGAVVGSGVCAGTWVAGL